MLHKLYIYIHKFWPLNSKVWPWQFRYGYPSWMQNLFFLHLSSSTEINSGSYILTSLKLYTIGVTLTFEVWSCFWDKTLLYIKWALVWRYAKFQSLFMNGRSNIRKTHHEHLMKVLSVNQHNFGKIETGVLRQGLWNFSWQLLLWCQTTVFSFKAQPWTVTEKKTTLTKT